LDAAGKRGIFAPMALILCIESATDICSVAIAKDGLPLAEQSSEKPYSHTTQLTLLIRSSLNEAGMQLADLDAVAVSRGPGSYTALRVGTAVAKGICYTLQKPLLSIDTLLSIALASAKSVSISPDLLIPMIDARRMEVYTAVFDKEGKCMEEVSARILDSGSFQSYLDEGKQLLFSGNGAPKAQKVITHPGANWAATICQAAHLCQLAETAFQQKQWEDIAYYEPFYFKAPNITQPKKKLL
jgi:tRNA threonylcarbamoyladenosine biosynthesis protein TsaB